MRSYLVAWARRLLGRLRCEKGQVTAEYGMVIILVLVAVIAAIVALRGNLQNVLSSIANALTSR